MIWQPGWEAESLERLGAVELVIRPREKELGGFAKVPDQTEFIPLPEQAFRTGENSTGFL